MTIPQCRLGNSPQGRSNKPAASGLSWEQKHVFGFFLLCFLVVATLVTPEASQKSFRLHHAGIGQGTAHWSIFWRCFHSQLHVCRQEELQFLSPITLIHENLLFGHLIARNAWGSGCRRMEEAVEGSCPYLTGFLCSIWLLPWGASDWQSHLCNNKTHPTRMAGHTSILDQAGCSKHKGLLLSHEMAITSEFNIPTQSH